MKIAPYAPLIVPMRETTEAPLPRTTAGVKEGTHDFRWAQFLANRQVSQQPVTTSLGIAQPSPHAAMLQSARVLLAQPNEASVFGKAEAQRVDRALPAEQVAAAETLWKGLAKDVLGTLMRATPALLREMDACCWRDQQMGLRKWVKKETSGAERQNALLQLDRSFGVDNLSGIAEKFLTLNQLALDGEVGVSESELVTNYATTTNNKLSLLVDGENAFPQILGTIDQAKETVNVEFFIVQNDRLGNALADALIAASARGCEVRISIDAIGSHLQSKDQRALVRRMREGGVEVHENWVAKPMDKNQKLNHPSHRKIVICDGKVGFTGGMNVAEHYVNEYHDLFVRAEGDVVKQMQSEFLLQWVHTGGGIAGDREELARKFFPKLAGTVGSTSAKVAQGIPGERKEIMQTYIDRINSAQKRVLIENPYITEPTVRQAAIEAAKRGVEVRVIVPGRNDQWYSAMALRTHYASMIDAGMQVYEYPGFNHGKTMVVDDKFVTIGTSNLDDVGLRHIYEMNLNIEDEDFAYQVTSQVFAVDIPKARLMKKEDVTTLQDQGGKVLSAVHSLM